MLSPLWVGALAGGGKQDTHMDTLASERKTYPPNTEPNTTFLAVTEYHL